MEKRTLGCLGLGLALLLCISVLINLIMAVSLQCKKAPANTSTGTDFIENVIEEGDSDSDKIAVIDLIGVISSEIPGQYGESMVEDVVEKLKQARKDDNVKTIILRIDSPGGEVGASDLLYHEVCKTRDKKPVLVYMESVAASGGYYTAMGASRIMSGDLTITGSIGVIMQTINYKDLLDKIGVKALTFKSGKMKDMLNPARESTPEEMKYVQDMVMETYDKFVGIVAKERKLDVNVLKQGIADGRILSGKNAQAEKLVDDIGYFEDAITKAKEMGKAPNAQVIRYNVPFSFNHLLRFIGKSDFGKIQIQMPIQQPLLQSGKLYYLSPHLFGRG